jgi:hypothetical protein
MSPKLIKKILNNTLMRVFIIKKLETNNVKNKIKSKEIKNENRRDFLREYLLLKSKLKILDSMSKTMKKIAKK